MKKIFLTLSFLLLSLSQVLPQEVKRNGNTFYVEVQQDIKTNYNYRIKDTEYPIYVSSKGKLYIVRVSKAGKEYKYYLPEDVQEAIKKEIGL